MRPPIKEAGVAMGHLAGASLAKRSGMSLRAVHWKSHCLLHPFAIASTAGDGIAVAAARSCRTLCWRGNHRPRDNRPRFPSDGVVSGADGNADSPSELSGPTTW